MGSRNKKKVDSDSDAEDIEQMKIISDHFREKITELNKRLLTVADVSIPKGRNEAILSWRKKNPKLISANNVQEEDDCWAHVHARGLYAVLKQRRFTGIFPTAEFLVENIEQECLTENNGLPKSMDVAPLLLREYGCRLIVHCRPKLGSAKENEDFEKFIERQLAIAPVAMCFNFVPGYSKFQHRKHDVFRPSYIDLAAMQYESLDDHCALITGRGVVFRGGESVEFWETHETQGDDFGDNGFTRIERYKRLVTEIYEYKF